MHKSSNRRKILTNVYWATLGKVVNISSGILVGVLVARYLGPTQFGVMNYVISYVTLFSVFSNFGMDSIEIRELAKDPEKQNAVLGTAFTMRLILSFLTVIAVLMTSLVFEVNGETMVMIWIYSFSLILSSFNIVKNYFTSILQNEYVVKTEILRNLIGAGIKVILLLFHAPLLWFVIASTFDFVIIGGGYLVSYKAKVGKTRKWYFDTNTAKLLLKESFPLMLSGSAIIIYQRIDQVMISKMIDEKSNGYFSVAARFIEFAIFIPNIISQTVAPLLVQNYHKNINEYYKKRQYFLNLLTWSGIALSFILSASAYGIVMLLFGEEYYPAVTVLQIMAFKSLGSSLFASSSQIIITEGIHMWSAIRNIIALAVCIGLNLWLIPVWGINGSAVASVLTVLFAGFVAHIFIKSYRPLFKMQCLAIYSGWRSFSEIIKNRRI